MPVGSDFIDDIETRNDTLFPIIFPGLKGEYSTESLILWFTFTDQLYNILSFNHKETVNEFLRYKAYKKLASGKDLIYYVSPYYIEMNKVLKLSNVQLEKLGFKYYEDSVEYKGFYNGNQLKWIEKNSGSGSYGVRQSSETPKSNLISIFVTNTKGSPHNASFMDYSIQNMGIDEPNLQHCIPVLVERFGWSKNLIFWFLPTDGFFEALPKEISQQLQAEYNYITAPNKAELEKPECKYFDECRNTLDASNFKVFPNPANSNATVSFTLNEPIDGQITLVDLAGREQQVLQAQTQFSSGFHRLDMDVSEVPEGVYLITLYSDKGIQVQRFIVAR